ncbi:TetR/AcrR family transcriptional regulator [Marinomonas epiphytica]
MEVLTETGYVRSGLDNILSRVSVPKGSFYYYFSSKEVFGLEVLAKYRQFFEHSLDRCLLDTKHDPLERFRNFAHQAALGMNKYECRRGCLVGNLEQESIFLSQEFRLRIQATYSSWEKRVEACLLEAAEVGEVKPMEAPADVAKAFWIGWEGAVHRARLEKNTQALEAFMRFFIHSIKA